MQAKGIRRNTGSPSGDRRTGINWQLVRVRLAVWGDGKARSTVEAG